MNYVPFNARQLLGPIVPYDWPQDQLQIPAGQGLMPEVELQNKYQVGNEGYVYSGMFSNLAFGAVSSRLIIPTQALGDFWCDSIYFTHFQNGTTTIVDTGLKLQIEDIRTGWKMFYPEFGRTSLFKTDDTMDYTGELMQQICFTRNGGIRISVQNDVYNTANLDVYLAFSGWLEYQYAST